MRKLHASTAPHSIRSQRGNGAFTGVVASLHWAGGLIRGLRRHNGIGQVFAHQGRSGGCTMTRNDLVLAVLAAAGGRSYSPAQLQKTLFLIAKNAPHIITAGPGFDFQPYDFGPFDRDVYVEAQTLRDHGDAEITPSPWGRWVTYAASSHGIAKGQDVLGRMNDDVKTYIQAVSSWALAQNFNSLVKSIYDAYPEMRVNSIFRDPA